MKIDLHCHTRNSKSGDGANREPSPELFVSKLQEAGVEIAAITNHDLFDYQQYQVLREKAAGLCDIWPGVELSMEDPEHEWHLIVVCNPDHSEAFAEAVSNLSNLLTGGKVRFNLDEVIDQTKPLDVIYIPHSHGKRSGRKSRAITDECLKELESKVPNRKRIIHEPNHHSLGVLSRNGYRVILGSDVKDWNRYQEYKVADFKFPIASFEAFARLVEGDPDTYNSIALKRESAVSLTTKPMPNITRKIRLYRGVNIVFGQKGTGKSKLIEAMARSLLSLGRNAALYKSQEAREVYNQDVDSSGIKTASSTVGCSDCQAEFDVISSWSDRPTTSFSDYVEYASSTDANKNRKRLVIADCGRTVAFMRQSELDSAVEDKKHVEKAIEEISAIDASKYIDKEFEAELKKYLEELLSQVNTQIQNLLVEKFAAQLLNFSINNIKTQANKRSEAPSAPNGTGFLAFAQNRIMLKKSCQFILKNINGQCVDSDEPYGYLEDKGEILLRTSYRMFGSDADPKEYYHGKKTALKSAKAALKKLHSNALTNEAAEAKDSLLEILKDGSITCADDFVGVIRRTVFPDGSPYEPSDGELAIILMKRFLSQDYDFYLLDEPEKGMGNSYIDKNIRGLITSLADNGKTVVLATHNANLAIRTMPVFSMMTVYQGKDAFTVFAGSPYSNQLVCLDDPGQVKNWASESMEILEGGKEAFYDRKDMYELF